MSEPVVASPAQGQDNSPRATVLETALAAHAAGLSVIPIRADGSKHPVLAWKQYQTDRPTAQQLRDWFSANPARGMAVIGGAVSGHLEMLEFEGRAVHAKLHEAYRRCADAEGLGEVLTRIQDGWLEQSPSGGLHLHYLCPDGVEGNLTDLAKRPATPEELAIDSSAERLLIETRGEGGYFITAPSNGRVHETGKPWKLIRGGFDTIATITAAERRGLIELARTFDQLPRTEWKPQATPATSGGLRPGDDFNARGTWAEILEPFGWTYLYTVNDAKRNQRWRRPGRDFGSSATISDDGDGLFYVHTSTSAPFDSKKAYSKFGAYTILNHGGDFNPATKALAALGYGDKSGEIRHSTPSKPSPVSAAVRLISAATVRPETVTWAMQGRIPVGMLSLLIGEGGKGKSLLGCYLSAGFSRGTIPGDFFGQPVDVAIASSEDHRAAVIVPRLMAAGADLSRVHFVEQVGEEGIAGDIDIDGDIDRLEAALLNPQVRFLFIDTVVSHIPSEHDSHKEQHVRRVLAPLARVAERNAIAVLGTMHLNRREGRNVLTRILGSSGFGNLARSVLVFGSDPQEPPASNKRLLAHGKCNVGPELPTLRVQVDSAETSSGGRVYPTARVEVLEEVPGVYAGDLLSIEDVDQEERSARGEAAEYLKDALADGPRPAKDFQACGFSTRTLDRARKELGVRAYRQGVPGQRGGGYWAWELPPPSINIANPATHTGVALLTNSEFKAPESPPDVGGVNGDQAPPELGPCEHCGRPAARAIGRVLTCDESPCKASALRLLAAGVTAR